MSNKKGSNVVVNIINEFKIDLNRDKFINMDSIPTLDIFCEMLLTALYQKIIKLPDQVDVLNDPPAILISDDHGSINFNENIDLNKTRSVIDTIMKQGTEYTRRIMKAIEIGDKYIKICGLIMTVSGKYDENVRYNIQILKCFGGMITSLLVMDSLTNNHQIFDVYQETRYNLLSKILFGKVLHTTLIKSALIISDNESVISRLTSELDDMLNTYNISDDDYIIISKDSIKQGSLNINVGTDRNAFLENGHQMIQNLADRKGSYIICTIGIESVFHIRNEIKTMTDAAINRVLVITSCDWYDISPSLMAAFHYIIQVTSDDDGYTVNICGDDQDNETITINNLDTQIK